jgi:hypothetical protein
MTAIVGLYYDAYDQSIQAQILRDLLTLSVQFGAFSVNDTGGMVPKAMLEDLGLTKDGGPPELCIRYKTGEDWPETPRKVETVDRDLNPGTAEIRLHDQENNPGYYLRPQGRDGANLTDRYLNRSAPTGQGIASPLIMLLWG